MKIIEYKVEVHLPDAATDAECDAAAKALEDINVDSLLEDVMQTVVESHRSLHDATTLVTWEAAN